MTYTELCRSIEERLLDFANCWPEVSTSDLQGMAMPIAREIIADCRLADGAQS